MNTIKARFDFYRVKPLSDTSVSFSQVLNEKSLSIQTVDL